MNNPDHISQSLETIFWDPGSGMEKIRIRDPGWKRFKSGIQDGKKSDPGSGKTSRIRNTASSVIISLCPILLLGSFFSLLCLLSSPLSLCFLPYCLSVVYFLSHILSIKLFCLFICIALSLFFLLHCGLACTKVHSLAWALRRKWSLICPYS
jgi:hypothetical protein